MAQLSNTFPMDRAGWCQFKVTGWGIMFICGMVLERAGTLKPGLSLDQLRQI